MKSEFIEERSEVKLAAFAYALLPTGFAVLLSFALAKWRFENMYYLSLLIPVCMVFYVALAWFIYLRHEGAFAWLGRRKPPANVLGHNEPDLARDLPEDKASGKELRYLRDEDGFIFRREEGRVGAGTAPGIGTAGGETSSVSPRRAIAILLWSALQLAVLATVLYHCFGIGATFYY